MAIVYKKELGRWIDEETGEAVEAPREYVNNTDEPVNVVAMPGTTLRVVKNRKPIEKFGGKDNPFVMIFQSHLRELMKSGQLSVNERAVLLTLAISLSYEGPPEVEDTNGQFRRLEQRDLYPLMGWSSKSKTTLAKTLDSLESKELIVRYQHGNTNFIDLNPKYFYMGKDKKRGKEAYLSFLEKLKDKQSPEDNTA